MRRLFFPEMLSPAAPRLSDRTLFILWLAAAGLLLWLVVNPVDALAQLWVGLALAGVLVVARRFELRGVPRLIFFFLAAYLSLRYFWWRTTTTLVFHDPLSFALGAILYLAELYGIVVYLLGIFVNLSPLDRQPVPLQGEPESWPTVDIFIPTYNEPPEIIEATLLAALQIDYPREKFRVFLCDDGGTLQKRADNNPQKAAEARERHDHLRALCERIGARYMTRERNLHAKAGNVNSALHQSDGELVLILDVDHVPTREILRNTVGWFQRDPKMFLVQTPHFFTNPDPIEKNLQTFETMPGENEMFYRVIQRGLDFWNASFFCGSAAVLRRKYLMEGGGIAGQTITEDAETALGLHGRGYRSAYIALPMISGLSPETFGGFIVQRMRWAQGMIQIFLLKNPLRVPGLRLSQRLGYFSSAFFWFFPFARIVFLLAPMMLLFFGLRIYEAQALDFFANIIPHLFAVIIVADYLYGHVRWTFVSELYEMMQSFYCLPAIAKVFQNPRAPTFAVTPKGEQLDRDFISPLVRPFYLFTIITIAAILAGIARLVFGIGQAYPVVISLIWSGFNLVLLLACLGALLERRQRRATPRMPLTGEAAISAGGERIPARASDISMGGTGLVVERPLPVSAGGEAVLHFRARPGEPMHEFHVIVRSQRPLQGCAFVGVEFAHRTTEEAARKVALVAGSSERWVEFQRQRERRLGIWRSLRFLLRTGFRYSRFHARARLRQEWAEFRGELRAIGRTAIRFLTGEPLRETRRSLWM
jgi:cellulose synthase (UDP-forming)